MADTDDSTRPAYEAEPRFVSLTDAALILGLQFLLLVFRLGQIPLLGPDEPRYARVAVEMARGNEFVTPTLAGEPWLEKPPLYYWLAGIGFSTVGETEVAARWPAVFSALLLTGFTGLVAGRLFGRSCARTAMIVIATSPLAFAYGRAATMDMLVAAFITGASGLFILSLLGIAGASAAPAAWAMMALAVLAKGPIGLIIPLGVALALLTSLGLAERPPFVMASARSDWQRAKQSLERSLQSMRRRWVLRDDGNGLSPHPARKVELRRIVTPLGIGLMILIAGPWFAAIYLDQGFKFVEVFILNHNLQRFTSTVHNHPGPIYYYLPVLFLGVFPWSGLLAPAAMALRSADLRPARALIAWVVVPLALFSVAGSKLPGYILPCLPPLAIGIGLFPRALLGPERRTVARAAGLIGLATAALVVAFSLRGFRDGEVWGRSAIPPALWLLATAFLTSRAIDRRKGEELRILPIGAAGFLLLLTLVAPPVLEVLESGRRLFLPAQGREVLVVGAWRTAWMSGYFYNNGQVKEIESLKEALDRVGEHPRLLLFGPAEWREIGALRQYSIIELARGARGAVLARVSSLPGR